NLDSRRAAIKEAAARRAVAPVTTRSPHRLEGVVVMSSKHRTMRTPPAMPTSGPLKWHGGKTYLPAKIVDLMLPHLNYVQPHFEGGAVLLERDPQDRRLWWPGLTSDGRKPTGVSELANDIHGDLINFYRVLRDPALFQRLHERLERTLLHEGEWQQARD